MTILLKLVLNSKYCFVTAYPNAPLVEFNMTLQNKHIKFKIKV